MSYLYHQLLERRKQYYLQNYVNYVETIMESKTYSEQMNFIHCFAHAICKHCNNNNEITYLISIQSPQHFRNSLNNILQHALLDILCLDICICSIKCER